MPAHNSMIGGPMPATAPMSGYQQTQVPLTPNGSNSVVIDGTPLRVVMIVAVAAAGAFFLNHSGIKFHVVAGV